jgi:hypothetical protein
VRLTLAKDTNYTTIDKHGYFLFILLKPGEDNIQVAMKGYSSCKKASG